MPPTHRQAKYAYGLRGKDEQIAQLEVQLEAQTAQSSLLHSRLTSTLDTMDSLKLAHERELSAQKRANDNAREKLRRFMEYASAVEQERDECRNALLAVVEKVEENSNLSTWSHSRVRLPEFLEPIGDTVQVQSPTKNPSPQIGVDDAGELSKAIAVWLRAALEKERMSHTRTHEQAELEILSLRAQLARREAELEACVAHTDHATLLASAVRGEGTEKPSQPRRSSFDDGAERCLPTLTPEDAVEILGLRVAKNRELETEIKLLSDKLQQTRMGSSKHGHENLAQSPAEPTGQLTPRSPDLRPLSPGDVLSPYAMTPRNAPTPRDAPGVAFLRASQDVTAPESTLKSALSEMQKLEEEVRNLAAGIDDLGEQRRLARKLVGQTRTRSPSPSPYQAEEDVSSQHTAVQSESDRRAREEGPEAGLRAELEHVRRQAGEREAELLAEIERMRHELLQRPAPLAPATGSLLDEDDAEKSMELGSPLAPVTILWAEDGANTVTMTAQRGETHKAPDRGELAGQGDAAKGDLAHLIPLPPSPTPEDSENSSPRPPSRSIYDRPPTPFASALTFTDTDVPVAPLCCSCAERLLVLERELEETKGAVAHRDEEIVDLRRTVNELRMATLGR